MELPNLKPQWFHILLAIADRPLHGYAIMTEVLDRTGGRMRLWPGMLYGSLKRMARDGLIEEVDEPAAARADNKERRFYRITSSGKRALSAEAKRLAEFVEAARMKAVLDESEPM
jgi:DNA-binding PadR family transcriptional regulator